MDKATLYELKCRLLINGIAIDQIDGGSWKERIEHLYQHDSGTGPTFRYPQELILSGEEDPGLHTVVNVRFNSRSAWRLTSDGQGSHYLSGPELSGLHVRLVERPAYYDQQLSTNVPASDVVQHLGRDALGVIPNNYCSYFADNDQCKFCEIEPSYIEVGKYPTMRKPTDVIVEAVNLAMAEPTVRHLIMTAGNLRSNDRTTRYYCDILQRIRDGRHKHIYRYGSIMPPETPGLIAELNKSGLDGVGFNLEFFDRAQFARLAPGKEKFGRERLIRALMTATESFGVGHTFTNMVFGIQTWQARGASIDFAAETDICLRATEYLLARGTIPLFTLYHSANKNEIGPVALDVEATRAFHLDYARMVHASGIVPSDRSGILFNVGTIANSICNDAYVAIREEQFVQAAI